MIPKIIHQLYEDTTEAKKIHQNAQCVHNVIFYLMKCGT
jgi:hypothetical protein